MTPPMQRRKSALPEGDLEELDPREGLWPFAWRWLTRHERPVEAEVSPEPAAAEAAPRSDLVARDLTVPLVDNGEPVADLSLSAARDRVVAGLGSLPWDGLKLSRGEPAIPTRMVSSAGRGA